MRYLILIILFFLPVFAFAIQDTCKHYVWDNTLPHGTEMFNTATGIIGYADSSCLLVGHTPEQVLDSIAHHGTRVISRSAGESSYPQWLVDKAWYNHKCIFVTAHFDNSFRQPIEKYQGYTQGNDTGFSVQVKISAGDSVTQNYSSSFGNTVEFSDGKPGVPVTTQSQAVAAAGARFFQLSNALPNADWWEIRYRARKTAKKPDPSEHDIFNGFGQIDSTAAVDFSEAIPADPYEIQNLHHPDWGLVPITDTSQVSAGKPFISDGTVPNYQRGRLFIKQ